jgi:hypothetical protein
MKATPPLSAGGPAPSFHATMLALWQGAKNRQLAKALFGSVEESENFRGSCGGHLTDDWHYLVADGKATDLADPSPRTRLEPCRYRSRRPTPSLGTMTRRRARIKR